MKGMFRVALMTGLVTLAATSVEGETFRTMAEARTFEITQIAGLLVGQIWLDDNAVLPSALDLITFR